MSMRGSTQGSDSSSSGQLGEVDNEKGLYKMIAERFPGHEFAKLDHHKQSDKFKYHQLNVR